MHDVLLQDVLMCRVSTPVNPARGVLWHVYVVLRRTADHLLADVTEVRPARILPGHHGQPLGLHLRVRGQPGDLGLAQHLVYEVRLGLQGCYGICWFTLLSSFCLTLFLPNLCSNFLRDPRFVEIYISVGVVEPSTSTTSSSSSPTSSSKSLVVIPSSLV